MWFMDKPSSRTETDHERGYTVTARFVNWASLMQREGEALAEPERDRLGDSPRVVPGKQFAGKT
jgi:hypothetical protein